MRYQIQRLNYPELVIGLVAPIGTPLTPTKEELTKNFEASGYEVVPIHVTDIFKTLKDSIKPLVKIVETPLNERYDTYIKYGNQIREETENNSILAKLTIERIVEERIKRDPGAKDRYTKKVYILNQFKRPEEISLLRSVYGKIFFQVSVYSRRSNRVDHLSQLFADEKADPDKDNFRQYAEELVNQDQNEEHLKHGQRVSKIFHDADFIVNKDIQEPEIKDQIERFFELLFSSNAHTPTKIEYGMFAAKSAALRTSDLSRQVGAAIFKKSGEILALGSNEVPKAGGGTYWPDEKHDDREFKRGLDSNIKRKRELLDEVLSVLNIKSEALTLDQQDLMAKTGFMDAIEYGRIVHAEMCAITDAARVGHILKGATLYSTTFPCHICAKHIVASGIERVLFLEPYPKSLASKLHSDAISIEKRGRGEYEEFPSVEFIHFHGITPRRYREFFQRSRRKNKEGAFQEYIGGKKRPFIDIKSPFYAQLEEAVLAEIKSASANGIDNEA